MKTANIGTVSSGTLRTEDLIPAMLDELRALNPANLLIEAVETRSASDDYHAVADSLFDLDALQEALEEHAPSYCYFGGQDGDGSEWGFWICWELINDDIHDGILGTTDDHKSQYININDHGNATLYARDQAGNWVEVWAVV